MTSKRRKRPRTRIGVAQDEAFNFYYEDNFDYLRSLGAEIVPFSPLRDELPDVSGLYFGGGYPELYAQRLEENVAMRNQVKKAAQAGMPIYAECGGMMYACRTVGDFSETKRAMCGIFDAEVEMTERLQAIGYVEVEARKDNMLCLKGWTTRGHEFHYSRVTCTGETEFAYNMKRGKGIQDGMDGFLGYNTLASYTHLHFASCPDFARRFVDSCIYNRRR
jgi:cobyrinic acid a,c-diamide synthase